MKMTSTMKTATVFLVLNLSQAATLFKANPGVISAHLRGASELSACDGKKPCKAKEEDKGKPLPRGHFYYAKSCDDCVYKGTECGCEPVLEYFACRTKFCHPSNASAFADDCAAMSSKCYFDLDLRCRGEHTDCASKFHQKPTGGLGLKMDVVEDDAFCGPYGKCLGHLRLKVQVVNRPKPPPPPLPTLVLPGPAPAPTPAAAPSPGPAVSAAPATPTAVAAPIWVECGLPAVDKPEMDKTEDWVTCQTEAKEGCDEAACDLALPA